MIASPGHLVSVQVGRVAPLGPNRTRSGFVKRPIDGPVLATAIGLAGDEQADHRVHGGLDKAIYGYGETAYSFWRTTMPGLAARMGPGAMGENLTLAAFDETSVFIGDRVRVGKALLQVTEPRQPCFKLALAFGDPALPRAFTRSGRCGWYYRTLEPGMIAAGDNAECVERPNPDWSVGRFFEVVTARAFGRETLAEIVALEGIGTGWKLKALQGLARLRGDP